MFYTQLKPFYCLTDKAWVITNSDSIQVTWPNRRHKLSRNSGQLFKKAALIKKLSAAPLLLILKQKDSEYRADHCLQTDTQQALGDQLLPAGHKSLRNTFHLAHWVFTYIGLTAETAPLGQFHQRYWLNDLINRKLRGKLKLYNLW